MLYSFIFFSIKFLPILCVCVWWRIIELKWPIFPNTYTRTHIRILYVLCVCVCMFNFNSISYMNWICLLIEPHHYHHFIITTKSIFDFLLQSINQSINQSAIDCFYKSISMCDEITHDYHLNFLGKNTMHFFFSFFSDPNLDDGVCVNITTTTTTMHTWIIELMFFFLLHLFWWWLWWLS